MSIPAGQLPIKCVELVNFCDLHEKMAFFRKKLGGKYGNMYNLSGKTGLFVDFIVRFCYNLFVEQLELLRGGNS